MDKATEIAEIKALRELTGISLGECKRALEESGFDRAAAMLLLKQWGQIDAGRRSERRVAQGRVASYIHGDGRIGVLLQVDCETDFVAKSDEFGAFMHEVCLQVAAMAPSYVDVSVVPPDIVTQELTALRARALASGKPEAIIEKIAHGQLQKFYSQVCLLEQPYVRDPSRRVRDLLNDLIQKTGENVAVRRFSRFEAGMAGER